MSLQIVYGRSGSGKTSYIFEEISKNISNGRKKYIITPEQFSFTAEKELLKKIKEESNSSAVVTAEVLTFARMAHRVSNEVGGITKSVLSKSGKAMILYSILSNKKNELKFLGKSNSNIELIFTQITELKKHGVSLENLKNLKEQIKDEYLYQKLNDIYIVYQQYEEKISEKYIDESDDLTRLVEQLDKTSIFDDSEIYIDEFVGFTKQEYLIIEKLMKASNKMIITSCSDDIENSISPDVDVFYSNKKTIKNILDIANINNVKILNEIYLQSNKRSKNVELVHLEKNIFNNVYSIYEKEPENIKIFLANNQYSELEHVANNIIKLVRDNKYKYSDISIIVQNIDTYSSLCKAIFSEYKIPIYIDSKKELSDNVLAKFILAVLDIYAKNWSNESIISYLKTGFLQIEENDIFLLEKYIKKWNIRGKKSYKEEWNFHDEKEFGEENIEKINILKKEFVTPLLRLQDELGNTKTAKQISENLYNFLINNNIDIKFENIIESLEEEGKLDIASQYDTSWKIVMDVLDEITMAFEDEKISFENYAQIMKIGFSNSELGTIQMAHDEVTIGDVDRTRSHKVKAVFIVGLNDGSFPSLNKSEGFLNDADRDSIKKYGVELANGTLEQIYEENFNIYKAFTTPEEKLFLSYASSSSEGKSLRQSTIVNKIKKIFPNLKSGSDILNYNIDFESKSYVFNTLLEKIREFYEGEEIEPIWFSIYNIFAADEVWNEKLKNTISLIEKEKTKEKISKENIEKMYGDTLKTSVSRLEQYRSCPFSYFIKYGLKLNEKETFKVEALDTGSFMHEVVDSFFNIIEKENLNIRNLNEDEIDKIVSEIVIKKLKLDKNYIFSINEKYRNLAKRLQKVVATSMKYIVRSISQSSFDVLGHEVEFGENKEFKPIKVSTSSGKTVEITGKIDRIDIAKNNDGTYVRIIDYKSSVKNVDLNKVVAGLQIQLLTYLNEMCKVEDFIPAGVLYFDLDNPSISTNKNLTNEEIANEIKKKFRMTGLIVADVNVIKMMDNNLKENTGASEIIPGGLTAKGEISKSQNIITKSQFENLNIYMDKIIKEISEEILNGNIEAKPYYNSKVNKGKTPCYYCKYKSICKFEPDSENSQYNYIGTLNKDTIIEKIK